MSEKVEKIKYILERTRIDFTTCKHLLDKFDWDLDKAMSVAVLFEPMVTRMYENQEYVRNTLKILRSANDLLRQTIAILDEIDFDKHDGSQELFDAIHEHLYGGY